ncbi:MAG: hypothetical protein DMF71_12225 [Acidobacteria bacterium]|nr:MAG: hypothetical protein DMF71_12225 [Acidobacteriota bacterium]
MDLSKTIFQLRSIIRALSIFVLLRGSLVLAGLKDDPLNYTNSAHENPNRNSLHFQIEFANVK